MNSNAFVRMSASLVLALLLSLNTIHVFAQSLELGPEDLRIEQRADGGFHLYIRKHGDIESVLLVESTRDPTMRADNYAYRAKEWNAVNGDEKRILDGQFIEGETARYSLVATKTEKDAVFGEAFHVFIPWIVEFGYPWTRHGELYVVDGTYFNIRSFAMGFADYRGSWTDNPFTLRVSQAPQKGEPEGNYMREAVEAFAEISEGGKLIHSRGPADIAEKIKDALELPTGRSVDIVVVLDTTASMDDDIDEVRKKVVPIIKELAGKASSLRVGMVLFKDYYEQYLTNKHDFTSDLAQIQRRLDFIRVGGGRDIPEAVYEALHVAATGFPWSAQERIALLIGDAPPHPRQRGAISKEMALGELARRNVVVNAIILPQ